VTNPLMEAIERLTNPYAMQERTYRNRTDAQEEHEWEERNNIPAATPVKVVTVRDAAHLADILNGRPFEWDEHTNMPVGTEQDGQ